MKSTFVSRSCWTLLIVAGSLAQLSAEEPRGVDSQVEIQPASKRLSRPVEPRAERSLKTPLTTEEVQAQRITQLENQLRDVTERLARTEARLYRYEYAFTKKKSIVR